jgi:hypothetical protein
MASTMMPPNKMNKASVPCFSASIRSSLCEMPDSGADFADFLQTHQIQAKITPKMGRMR